MVWWYFCIEWFHWIKFKLNFSLHLSTRDNNKPVPIPSSISIHYVAPRVKTISLSAGTICAGSCIFYFDFKVPSSTISYVNVPSLLQFLSPRWFPVLSVITCRVFRLICRKHRGKIKHFSFEIYFLNFCAKEQNESVNKDHWITFINPTNANLTPLYLYFNNPFIHTALAFKLHAV